MGAWLGGRLAGRAPGWEGARLRGCLDGWVPGWVGARLGGWVPGWLGAWLGGCLGKPTPHLLTASPVRAGPSPPPPAAPPGPSPCRLRSPACPHPPLCPGPSAGPREAGEALGGQGQEQALGWDPRSWLLTCSSKPRGLNGSPEEFWGGLRGPWTPPAPARAQTPTSPTPGLLEASSASAPPAPSHPGSPAGLPFCLQDEGEG